MRKLILIFALGLILSGCGNNPVQNEQSKTDKVTSNGTIIITTNQGTNTFEYEKIYFINNELTITIVNQYTNQEVIYNQDSIIYYETFK